MKTMLKQKSIHTPSLHLLESRISGSLRNSNHNLINMLLLIMILTFFHGCASSQKNQKLEEVARNWCMTIRASQVIPVYPLTEDLLPGDIFLVQVPVDRQHEIYNKKGFLPLDNHILRLNPDKYEQFYSHSFNDGENPLVLPRDWMKSDSNNQFWTNAPNSAFPSYRFSVRSGGGFNLAIPVQGIPIGLSLLGSDAADGTITISKSFTYGIDILSLYTQVVAKSEEDNNFKEILAHLSSTEDHENFLRIINRVYMVKDLDISLRDSSAISAGLDAGLPRPVELPVSKTGENVSENTVDTYKNRVIALNSLLDSTLEQTDSFGKLLPGASLRVASTSAGTIGLKETFDRPLVIGYLGFDIKILPDGWLSSPIPTHSLLEGNINPVNLSFSPKERLIRSYMQKLRQSDKMQKNFVEKIGGSLEAIYIMAPDDKKSATLTNLIQLLYIDSAEGTTNRDKIFKTLKEVVEMENVKPKS